MVKNVIKVVIKDFPQEKKVEDIVILVDILQSDIPNYGQKVGIPKPEIRHVSIVGNGTEITGRGMREDRNFPNHLFFIFIS